MQLTVLLALLMLSAGAALLALGLRSRRRGNEPRCRACGYNLTGSASPACPECGADVRGGGTVLGQRHRRPALVASGVIVLLIGAALSWASATRGWNAANRYRWYPAAWVRSAARGGDARALDELERRLTADRLSAQQVDQTIADALAEQQATAVTPLTERWVNILERLSEAGRLNSTQRATYLEHLVSRELRVRPQVRLGDEIPIQLAEAYRSPDPASSPTNAPHWVTLDLLGLYLLRKDAPDSRQLNSLAKPIAHAQTSEIGRISESAALSLPITTRGLEPGNYQVVCLAREKVYDAGITDPAPDANTPLLTRDLRLTGDVTIAPAEGTEGAEFVRDAALARKVEDAIEVERVEYFAPAGQKPHVTVQVRTAWQPDRRLPIDVAFEVSLRTPSNEWPIGQVSFSAGQNAVSLLNATVDLSGVDRVDVVLKPDLAAARQTVELTRVLDHEVILQDVPVEHR